jgi:hypothetical protein
MYSRCVAAIAAASLMAGCAIHPVPEDVTGVPTQGIVKQIRCETRDAVRAVVLRVIDRMAANGDQRAQDISSLFHADPEQMNTFSPDASFSRPGDIHVREVFDLIYSAAIAYNFDLTMSEDNNLTTGVSLLGLGQTTFNLGITGDANRTRKNEREFTITDKLGYLLTTLNTPQYDQQYCDGHITVAPNYIYPIVGRIGVYNTVYTFFQLSFFDGLAPDPGKKAGDGTTPAMADILTFTTAVDLIATPKVTFAQVKTGFNIADASATGTARRTDVHQVTLALALDPKSTAPLTSLRGYVFSSERSSGSPGRRIASGRGEGQSQVVVLNRITASATSRAAQLALIKIDQLKSRELQLIPQ